LLEWGNAALHAESFNPSAWLSSAGKLVVLIPIFATVALVGALAVYLSAERQ